MAVDPGMLAAAASSAMSTFGNLGSNVFNVFMQRRQNKQNQQWQEKMYGIQRQDALADWAMQSEYNSPRAQMDRLRSAGLNPHLVYGNGADATMGDVRTSSVGSYSGQAPTMDLSRLGEGLSSFYDMRLKNAQMDNLAANKAVQEQEVLLKAAQTQKTLQDSKSSEFDLKMKNELKEINKNMAAQSLNKLTSEVGILSNQSSLASETFQAQVEKTKAEAAKALQEANASQHLEKRVLQELDNLKKDGNIKDFTIKLQQLGIDTNSPWYIKLIGSLGIDVYKKFGKYMNKF